MMLPFTATALLLVFYGDLLLALLFAGLAVRCVFRAIQRRFSERTS